MRWDLLGDELPMSNWMALRNLDLGGNAQGAVDLAHPSLGDHLSMVDWQGLRDRQVRGLSTSAGKPTTRVVRYVAAPAGEKGGSATAASRPGTNKIAHKEPVPPNPGARMEREEQQRRLMESSPEFQAGNAAGAFARGLLDTVVADTVDGDKYFHCKANCEATRAGPWGEVAAGALSLLREASDPRNVLDGFADARADDAANRQGRKVGRASPEQSCSDACASLRPAALPKRY
jgi:Serum amyloid A protein